MAFTSGDQRSFSDLQHVGVAVKHVGNGQNHVGILYRPGRGAPRMCHFANHLDLRDEPARSDYFWDDCGFLRDDAVNGKFMAARVRSIAQTKSLPYGIVVEGDCFAPDGTFIGFPQKGMGFTCASFIVAVFHSAGYYIVETDTWEQRSEDAAWQTLILDYLEEDGVDEDHIEEARKFVNGLRYRPEEVAAAVANDHSPISFADAVALAEDIKKLIQPDEIK